jgi:protein-disulfide isomerase
MEDAQKPGSNISTTPTQSQNDQKPVSTEVKKGLKPNVAKFIAPMGVVVVTLVLAGALVLNKDEIKKSATTASTQNTQQVAGADTAPDTTGTGTTKADITKVKTDNEPFLGDANAPVTIAYWSDYQCPYCKQFELATMPSVIQTYVNSGKAKIVFKDFQFLGNDSMTAAVYARAIWELYPKEYFPWREAFFNKQDGENTGFGDEESIKALTGTIVGIDVGKVVAQVESKSVEYQTAIKADRAEGASMGVTGTPGFITGTQLISGAATASAFTAAIDPQLK